MQPEPRRLESLHSAQTESVPEERRVKRRSRLEVQMDMLTVVRGGARAPTRIMYRANLAWVTLREELAALTESGLLRRMYQEDRRRYELTEKGERTLDLYRKVVRGVQMGRTPEPESRFRF